MTVREFTAHHRGDPGMTQWLEGTKPLSSLISIIHLLRLDLLGRPVPRLVAKEMDDPQSSLDGFGALAAAQRAPPVPEVASELGLAANDDELPMSVILDENGSYGASILCGPRDRQSRPAGDAEQERPEAPRGVPRRLGLRQNDARAVAHRAASAAWHSGRADRPQGRSRELRQPGRLARQRERARRSAAPSARSSPTPSTSPSIRRAALPAGRSRSRFCRTASTSFPSTSSNCSRTCRRLRSAKCCI